MLQTITVSPVSREFDNEIPITADLAEPATPGKKKRNLLWSACYMLTKLFLTFVAFYATFMAGYTAAEVRLENELYRVQSSKNAAIIALDRLEYSVSRIQEEAATLREKLIFGNVEEVVPVTQPPDAW